jgi:hypothetical protein
MPLHDEASSSTGRSSGAVQWLVWLDVLHDDTACTTGGAAIAVNQFLITAVLHDDASCASWRASVTIDEFFACLVASEDWLGHGGHHLDGFEGGDFENWAIEWIERIELDGMALSVGDRMSVSML